MTFEVDRKIRFEFFARNCKVVFLLVEGGRRLADEAQDTDEAKALRFGELRDGKIRTAANGPKSVAD